MLKDLTYSTHPIETSAGYNFGHRMALIRSAESSFDSIWAVDTSMAGGGPKKHADLIHVLARQFIEEAATSEHADSFADCFQDGCPALFLYHDGGEDPSENPTKVVCIAPRDWRLIGKGSPWRVCYEGTVYDVEGQSPPYRDGGFWNGSWMHQTTLETLEATYPDVADKIVRDFPSTTFSEPNSMGNAAMARN
ncbi:hypothetical protein G6L37_35150 [Agrobacterium rubi]|nr:hypothetical protein [Agrobacterium rubi]NTF23808.1 hypothetical protein [Agrobacterium rubi]